MHVAVAFVGLLGFSALTIDMGVFWVARGQAQNAADSAAMAAAATFAYVDRTDAGLATDAALATVAQSEVWGETPIVTAGSDLTFPACPPGIGAIAVQCVRVDVRREPGNGTPLPTFFGPLLGVASQSVRATATATSIAANETACLRPWAMLDRWNDNRGLGAGVWTPDDLFERYQPGGTLLPLPVDVYDPPTSASAGTGYRFPEDFGRQVSLLGATAFGPASGEVHIALDLPTNGAPVSAEERYRSYVAACSGQISQFGDILTPGFFGAAATAEAADELIASDSTAFWDGSVQQVRGSAFPISPRIVAVAVVDPDDIALQLATLGIIRTVLVRNIVGFFVEDAAGGRLTGVLVPLAGSYNPETTTVTDSASFLRTVSLLR